MKLNQGTILSLLTWSTPSFCGKYLSSSSKKEIWCSWSRGQFCPCRHAYEGERSDAFPGGNQIRMTLISDRDDDFNIIFNFYDISVSKLCPSAALLCKQGLTKSIIHSCLKKETDKTDCLVLRLFKNHTFQHSRAQRIDWAQERSNWRFPSKQSSNQANKPQ